MPSPWHFVILANAHWEAAGGGQPSRQLARGLGKLRIPYVYLNPLDRWVTQRRALRRLDPGHALVVCELPTRNFLRICRMLRQRGAVTIYRKIDPWEIMPENHWYDPATEKALLKSVDIVLAHSPTLLRQIRAVRPDAELEPNAVDVEQFRRLCNRPPRDLVQGSVTVGFWGTFFADWFDWRVIVQAASKLGGVAFNLIGARTPIVESHRPKLPPNVHLLGAKPWEDLYRYLSFFDVCVIPYRRTPVTARIQPVKALEYLAGGKPVVSFWNTALAELPYFLFYRNSSDFIRCIHIARSVSVNQRDVRSFLEARSLRAQVRRYANRADEVARRRGPHGCQESCS